MDVNSKETLLAEVDRLIELELYESAETLALLYISHLTTVEFKPKEKSTEPISLIFACVYEKLADALFKKSEIKRALQYYRSAIHRRRPQQIKFRGQGITNVDEARLRYKECKCQVELRDTAAILQDLESIPAHLRDAKIHLFMADMNKRAGGNRRRHAVQAYKDALLTTPLAIEIIEELVNLNVEAAEILSTLDEALRHKEAASDLTADGWTHTLVTALVARRNQDREKCSRSLQQLVAQYPRNVFLMAQQAAVCAEAEQVDEGLVLYRKIRREEPNLARRTLPLGRLLTLQEPEDAYELSRLADDVLEASSSSQGQGQGVGKRPEGWLLAGMYALCKDDGESALTLIDKAVALDPTCGEAYRLRGQTHLALESHNAALVAFSQANALDKDLASFAGLVKCHLALNKVKEAGACAREALSLFPRSCEAHILLGSVFAQTPSAAGECLSAYAKALQLNPVSKTAAVAMAEVLTAAGKAQEAVNILEGILKKVSCHKLRLALGKAYAAMGEYQSSVTQLHSAISLNPSRSNSSSAKESAAAGGECDATQELERVEGLMRGETEEEEECEEEEDEEDMDGHLQQQQSGYSGSNSLLDEEAETAASITLSRYYQAAGLLGAEEGEGPDELGRDMSHSLNPRDFTAYADEEEQGQQDGSGGDLDLEMSYFEEDHSGDQQQYQQEDSGDQHLLYGALDDSTET